MSFIQIYQTPSGESQIEVQFQEETVLVNPGSNG